MFSLWFSFDLWVYCCYLVYFLWNDLKVTQLYFNFTIHHVRVLFCLPFHGMHSSSLTYGQACWLKCETWLWVLCLFCYLVLWFVLPSHWSWYPPMECIIFPISTCGGKELQGIYSQTVGMKSRSTPVPLWECSKCAVGIATRKSQFMCTTTRKSQFMGVEGHGNSFVWQGCFNSE